MLTGSGLALFSNNYDHIIAFGEDISENAQTLIQKAQQKHNYPILFLL